MIDVFITVFLLLVLGGIGCLIYRHRFAIHKW